MPEKGPEDVHFGALSIYRINVCLQSGRLQAGEPEGGDVTPRSTKRFKEEWAFFLAENGRRSYNLLCLKCAHKCKQSFRAKVFIVFPPENC